MGEGAAIVMTSRHRSEVCDDEESKELATIPRVSDPVDISYMPKREEEFVKLFMI